MTLARPGPERLLAGVLALGRDLHLGLPARTLAERFLAGVTPMFPERLIAIRLLLPARSGTDALAGLVRRGRAPDEAVPRTIEVIATPGAVIVPGALSGPILLKRTSVDKTKLARSVIEAGQVRLVDLPEPLFTDDQGAVPGFSVPLVAGGDIYGALDVGYARSAEVGGLAEDDERALIPIANQLSVALRNVVLHGETELLRDYLAKLVDQADALIFGVDRHFHVTSFNQALSQLVGWPATLVLGRDVRDWIPEGERARFTAVVIDGLAGRPVRAFDLELRTRNGEPVRTLWNVAALGAGEHVEAVVAVGQDVTRLRSLERQVIQAEKLATLGQLAAGVVHELNNPLTSISIYADYLLKRFERGSAVVEPTDVEKLRRIVEGADRIQNFTRNLVQYAKPSPASAERIALADVVRQSLSFCEHMLRRSDAHLRVELGDELPPVYGVRSQLQQVVINVVTNALHALPGSGGQITVRSFRRDPGHLAISVEDNGSGIRAEDRPRIFEPFFTTKTDGRGTGLGLSIVRNIIEGHRGEIEVDSLPGRGTLFTVILPHA